MVHHFSDGWEGFSLTDSFSIPANVLRERPLAGDEENRHGINELNRAKRGPRKVPGILAVKYGQCNPKYLILITAWSEASHGRNAGSRSQKMDL
jgi:hypothetical protein